MFKHISALLFLVSCVLATPASAVDTIGSTLQGVMIWDAVDTSSPASVGFRKEITLSGTPASATLHVFADTRYMLWINGTYVARGPNRFDPKRPEYDTLNVGNYLNKGENMLAVLVQSHLSNYRFINHTPGLGLLLQTKGKDGHVLERFATDTTWRSSASTRFAPPVVMLSGITDRVDEWQANQGILVTTSRSFKGLEADVVIIYDLDALSKVFSLVDLYVACTRARSHVHFLVTGKQLLSDLRDAIAAAEQQLAEFLQCCKH